MKLTKRNPTSRTVAGHEPAFREIIGLIAAGRRRAFQAVNTELIELYWRVGLVRVSPAVKQTGVRSKVAPLVRQIPAPVNNLDAVETFALNGRPHPGPLPQVRGNCSPSFCVARTSGSFAFSSNQQRRGDRQFDLREIRIGQSLFPLPGGEGPGEGEGHNQSLLRLQ
ncbi:MAG: hypothetical protein U1F83_20570 [Verrucomicrobiota bacterium]